MKRYMLKSQSRASAPKGANLLNFLIEQKKLLLESQGIEFCLTLAKRRAF